jgi:hypothetical protein
MSLQGGSPLGVAVILLLTTSCSYVAAETSNFTNLGIFGIPFSFVASNTPTIDSETMMTNIFAFFESTPGFVSVSSPQPCGPGNLTYTYDVVYNKTILNNDNYLSNTSAFIESLQGVVNNFNSSANTNGDVNKTATVDSMQNTIQQVNETFNSASWPCLGNNCQTGYTCAWDMMDSGRAVCEDACSLFTNNNTQCTQSPYLPGVYLMGQCALTDVSGMPYCDCGSTAGLANFYDGTQCVSAIFIVAMAASAGALLLILSIALICTINTQRDEIRHARDVLVKYKLSTPPEISQYGGDGKSNKNASPYDSAIGTIVDPESRPQQQTGYYKHVSEDNEEESHQL